MTYFEIVLASFSTGQPDLEDSFIVPAISFDEACLFAKALREEDGSWREILSIQTIPDFIPSKRHPVFDISSIL